MVRLLRNYISFALVMATFVGIVCPAVVFAELACHVPTVDRVGFPGFKTTVYPVDLLGFDKIVFPTTSLEPQYADIEYKISPKSLPVKVNLKFQQSEAWFISQRVSVPNDPDGKVVFYLYLDTTGILVEKGDAWEEQEFHRVNLHKIVHVEDPAIMSMKFATDFLCLAPQ